MWELLLLVCEQCCSVSEPKLLRGLRSQNQPINIVSSTKSVITAGQKFPDCSTHVITLPNHIYDNSFFPCKVYIYVCTKCSLTCLGSSEKLITNTSLKCNILSFGCKTNARNKHSNGVSFWLYKNACFLAFRTQDTKQEQNNFINMLFTTSAIYSMLYIIANKQTDE